MLPESNHRFTKCRGRVKVCDCKTIYIRCFFDICDADFSGKGFTQVRLDSNFTDAKSETYIAVAVKQKWQ